MPEKHPLLDHAQRLCQAVDALEFDTPVTHVYNPLQYAGEPHGQYLRRYGQGTKKTVFVGMNPGPFGMAQTGIPFGEVAAVRDWLGISGTVHKPPQEHPKRPVDGFDCSRSEVSGRRLWALFAQRYGTANAFFKEHFVANYCPLLFLQADERGCRNFPPDKLPADQTGSLFQACDLHLQQFIQTLQPQYVVGVGAFAAARARLVLANMDVTVHTVLHPSPASPAANRDWAGSATRQLQEAGIWH